MNADDKEIINQALKLIEENLCDPKLKPSWLAKTLKVDLPNFCKKFKKFTGVQCTKYVAMRRVDAAKDLLKDGLQVKEIAGQVGYKDNNYFSRVFKKITGLSPQAYRSGLRNQKISASLPTSRRPLKALVAKKCYKKSLQQQQERDKIRLKKEDN